MKDNSIPRSATINVQLCPDEGRDALQAQLQALAKGIVAGLSDLELLQSKELLGVFVSELFSAAVEQERREHFRQKQAEGIAAAKARGTRFGRTARALPDNFDEVHQAWRNDQLTLKQAANACGMPVSSFYDAAVRKNGLKTSAG